MPIYEYQCQACGERFDKLIRSINQVSPEIVCPVCQSMDVQRLISAPTIHPASARSGSENVTETAASQSTGPAVFGRKELKQAQEKKRKLREQALYDD
jgi:putative FmdB family regulatory protein